MQYYEYKCVHCSSTNVFATTNDGGSIQKCNECHRIYKAKQIEEVKVRPENPGDDQKVALIILAISVIILTFSLGC